MRIGGEIEEDNANFSPVSGINRSRSVRNDDAMLECKAVARPDLGLVAGREFDHEASRDKARYSGIEGEGFHCAKPHSIALWALVQCRENRVCVEAFYPYSHKWLNSRNAASAQMKSTDLHRLRVSIVGS
jgi:hypothetical protein